MQQSRCVYCKQGSFFFLAEPEAPQNVVGELYAPWPWELAMLIFASYVRADKHTL